MQKPDAEDELKEIAEPECKPREAAPAPDHKESQAAMKASAAQNSEKAIAGPDRLQEESGAMVLLPSTKQRPTQQKYPLWPQNSATARAYACARIAAAPKQIMRVITYFPNLFFMCWEKQRPATRILMIV